MRSRWTAILLCATLFGNAIPLFAGIAHPKGPENRPFSERTIIFHGEGRDCLLTLSYPQPDDIAGDTHDGRYDVKGSDPFDLLLNYKYRGTFWQGEFGGILEPFLPQLNGIPCIKKYVPVASEPKNKLCRYFQIDESSALAFSVWFADNSDRPVISSLLVKKG